MTSPATARPSGETPALPVITVRYWAAARAAAGVRQEEHAGATVADVLAAARAQHGADSRFTQVLSVCSLLLGDRPIGAADPDDVAVADGDVLEVLPPFAGG